ncbi:MAG: hypothetical protein AAGA48_05375 [Myxococcota bacterium]
MWLALLVSTLSYAQSPLLLGNKGESRWLVEDVESDRFFEYDQEAKGPQLFKGDEVELIVTSGDRVRIKKGTRYGWVSASVLSTDAPVDDTTPEGLTGNPLLTPTP